MDEPNKGDITIRDIKKIRGFPQNHITVFDSGNLSVRIVIFYSKTDDCSSAKIFPEFLLHDILLFTDEMIDVPKLNA